jgi:CRP-like cAMP-binding protein
VYEGLDPALSVRSPIELELLLRAGVHADAPPEVIGRLLRVATANHYPAGAPVLVAGERPRRLVVITAGEVAVAGGAHRQSRGAPLGVLDALIGRPHPHDVVALTPLPTHEVSTADYLAILDDHVDISLALIDKLAEGAAAFARDTHPRLPSSTGGLPAGDPIQRMMVVRASAPFARATVQAQARIASDAVTRHLRAGEVLFRSESERLWLVASGAVRCSAGDPRLAVMSGPGEPVGQAAAFAQPPWLYDAVAATESVVLGVDRELLLDRMEEHVSLPRAIISYLGWLIAAAS